MNKRYAIPLLGLISVTALYVGGCASPARRPAPDSPATNNARNLSNMPEEISKIVRSRVRNQRRVETIMVGNIAVIGMTGSNTRSTPGPDTPGLPPTTTTPPPGGAPRPGAPGNVTTPPAPSTGGVGKPGVQYTPRAGSTGVIDRDTTREIIGRFPQLVRVYSTNDPVLVDRIASVARDVRNRRPIDRRMDEIAFIVNAVTGTPAAGTPARTPSGTP